MSALLALLLAPLLPGLIARVKALFAGRVGPPLLQPYHDLARLLRKGVVYSTTSTWVFRLAPSVVLAATLAALTVLPFGGKAVLAFPGDFLLLTGALALARFALVAGALDTGSAFEGMGASREVWIGALAEVGLLLSLAAVARPNGSDSLTTLAPPADPTVWAVLLALTLLALAECARIPFDDPNTHLELTMVHEVMVLDHSGPDLAYMLYASYLKLWILGGLILKVGGLGGFLPAILAWAVLIGVIESSTARVAMNRIPQFLALALGLAALALVMGS